ncbi:hypothetical protein C8I07_00225 [Shewanella baltica]|nr:hypothetical protein C8I07_00225 [Shewanella baltica]MCS6121799.1 hypothetical protein [Shewanella baltica]
MLNTKPNATYVGYNSFPVQTLRDINVLISITGTLNCCNYLGDNKDILGAVCAQRTSLNQG